MKFHRIAMTSCAGLAILAAGTLAQAEPANQLTTLNGLSAGGAESALQSRGFHHKSTHENSRGYTYSYWWDRDDRNCVRVEEYRGTVETIMDADAQDCDHGGGDAATAAGVVAGAAILGALLTHKSHHHEDGQHHQSAQDEALYDRGFNDGLYNAPYHNADRSDAYSEGYTAGVDQRSVNLREHTSRGGHHEAVRFADLQGARAAGGMEELERRGFRQVDNFTSGDTRYSIQWRHESRQCVQVTIADGHFYDIRDIGQNPNCRH